jgi:hypothetical protein
VARQENDGYLRGVWLKAGVPAVLVGVALLIYTLSSVADGSAAGPTALVAGLAIAGGAWAWGRMRVERAFRKPDPSALLQMFRSSRSGGASAEAWRAYFEAWVLTLYGRFEPARAALARVDWAREPPVVGAAGDSIEVLLCFLDARDFTRGFNLARSARAAAELSPALPGAKTAAAAYDCLVEIGRVLTGWSTATTIANLERHTRVLPFGGRLLATWGLAAAYDRAGDAARAAEALARCQKLAPYCTPLHTVPAPPQS